MSKQKLYRTIRKEIVDICESARVVQGNGSTNNYYNSSSVNIEHPAIVVEENNINEESEGQNTSSNLSDSFENLSVNLNSDCDNINLNNIEHDISEWSVMYNIARECLNSLLNILRKYHPNLPKDGRSLKKTPRKNDNIVPIGAGSYSHIGLEHQLKLFIERTEFKGSELLIDVGVDGIPLTKSSTSQLWPILANVISHKEVFVVGVYHGYKKPYCANIFLEAFVEEMKHLLGNNILYNDREIAVKVRAFICDAPARAFLLGKKNISILKYIIKFVLLNFFIRKQVLKAIRAILVALNVK